MPERMRLRFSICSAMVNTSFPSFNKENCPRTEKRVRLCARAGKFFLWCHLACRKLRPLTGMQITSPPDNGGCRQRILGVLPVPSANHCAAPRSGLFSAVQALCACAGGFTFASLVYSMYCITRANNLQDGTVQKKLTNEFAKTALTRKSNMGKLILYMFAYAVTSSRK